MEIIEAVGQVAGETAVLAAEQAAGQVAKKTGWPVWLVTFGCMVIFILGCTGIFIALILSY